MHDEQQGRHNLVHVVPDEAGAKTVIGHQALDHRGQTGEPRGADLGAHIVVLVVVVAHGAELADKAVVVEVVVGGRLVGGLLFAELPEEAGRELLVFQVVAACVLKKW